MVVILEFRLVRFFIGFRLGWVVRSLEGGYVLEVFGLSLVEVIK